MNPAFVHGRSGEVILCDLAPEAELIRERFSSMQILDISKGLPAGVRGDVLFGGRGPHAVEAMASGVRWVHLNGTGIDGLSPEVLSAPLLTVSRGASAVAISEYVITTMGAFSRNFPENWIHSSPERWSYQPASTLAGATLCLFGFGGIAQRVARIALAMEMSVLALRHHFVPTPIDGVTMVRSLPELLAVADHLVLAAPLTELTRRVINADSLAMTRRGVHLVNVSRGALVDHDALNTALDDGTVARASLDVTDPEPLPSGHWLFNHPKVFLTPHSSWVGPILQKASVDMFCDNLVRFIAGESLDGVVSGDGY